jgi:hypothetical protein
MAAIAQLGECQTEDLEVPSSILGHGILQSWCQLGEASGSQHALQDAPPPPSPFPPDQRVGKERHAQIRLAGRTQPMQNMRMPGVEPGSQAWGVCMIPLHYMRYACNGEQLCWN